MGRLTGPLSLLGQHGDQRGGRQLPATLLERLGQGLRADLSAVRIHTDTAADRHARVLRADAFTCGSHVFFRSGAYRPETTAGFRLLAHEAAHVVQQARAAASGVAPAATSEQDADRCAELLVAGQRAAEHSAGPTVVRPGLGPVIQRHVSYEHRVLGDLATDDLVAISPLPAGAAVTGGRRQEILDRQIRLCELWWDDPTVVTEEQVRRVCPWIRTLRLGPDRVLATYGEVNALPDYLANAPALEYLDEGHLLPILQTIRQEGYNNLSRLRGGSDPRAFFARSASPPYDFEMVTRLVKWDELDELTRDLGVLREDHFRGLLARNACHFAPFSWYRWETSHLIARDLAKQAHATGNAELARRAWTFAGYADHFLQDSFAAGHLVNKTLIMQWFVEWAAGQDLVPVADLDVISAMTADRQPGLAGFQLYDDSYTGPSNDPQTTQELPTAEERLRASGLVVDGPEDPHTVYQRYLRFLANDAAQLSCAMAHDYYNSHSLWVASQAHPEPYEVWGDATLLTGRDGAEGIRQTSGAAQLSQAAVEELIRTGEMSSGARDIRRHFPTMVRTEAGDLEPVAAWNTGRREFFEDNIFSAFLPALQNIMVRVFSPRLGVVSQDQDLAEVWGQELDGADDRPVHVVESGGRLFAGANGHAYEIEATKGSVRTRRRLADLGMLGSRDTRLATDGTTLFVGVHGRLHGLALSDLSPRWELSLHGPNPFDRGPVSVLWDGHRLLAGYSGQVSEIDPTTATLLRRHRLEHTLGFGGHETTLAGDGAMVFAGTPGHVYGMTSADRKARWRADLTKSGRRPSRAVSVLWSGGRLLAGSAGQLYEIDPTTGAVLHRLALTGSAGDHAMSLSAGGTEVIAAVDGRVYAVDLNDWSRVRWWVDLDDDKDEEPGLVSVSLRGPRLFVGSRGHLHHLDPATGRVRNSLPLRHPVSFGDFTTTISASGRFLHVGMHGHAYQVLVND
ncbi:eCIS core domain-containing protein [Actinopolymorpha singaporensis]